MCAPSPGHRLSRRGCWGSSGLCPCCRLYQPSLWYFHQDLCRKKRYELGEEPGSHSTPTLLHCLAPMPPSLRRSLHHCLTLSLRPFSCLSGVSHQEAQDLGTLPPYSCSKGWEWGSSQGCVKEGSLFRMCENHRGQAASLGQDTQGPTKEILWLLPGYLLVIWGLDHPPSTSSVP